MGGCTHSCTTVLEAWNPGEDGEVSGRLRAGGGVFLGKLKTTEGAYATHHPRVVVPLNPWGPELWTGVSSSGSGVATAARLCMGTLGSDTDGSIRFPSTACGVTGLKPTWGRVSRCDPTSLGAPVPDYVGELARGVRGLRVGFDERGAPFGFQLVGRHLAEPELLRVGHVYQQHTDWHRRSPGGAR